MREKPVVNQISSVHIAAGGRMSADDELVIIKEKVAYLRAHPKKLHKMMVAAGIYDEDGRLTKEYGG